jgi:hypothetical protein
MRRGFGLRLGCGVVAALVVLGLLVWAGSLVGGIEARLFPTHAENVQNAVNAATIQQRADDTERWMPWEVGFFELMKIALYVLIGPVVLFGAIAWGYRRYRTYRIGEGGALPLSHVPPEFAMETIREYQRAQYALAEKRIPPQEYSPTLHVLPGNDLLDDPLQNDPDHPVAPQFSSMGRLGSNGHGRGVVPAEDERDD